MATFAIHQKKSRRHVPEKVTMQIKLDLMAFKLIFCGCYFQKAL
jgi:hypothetical protein